MFLVVVFNGFNGVVVFSGLDDGFSGFEPNQVPSSG